MKVGDAVLEWTDSEGRVSAVDLRALADDLEESSPSRPFPDRLSLHRTKELWVHALDLPPIYTDGITILRGAYFAGFIARPMVPLYLALVQLLEEEASDGRTTEVAG